MNNLRYYLVEHYDPSLSYDDGVIISLTSVASYYLGEAKISYKIIEDYYREEDLRKNENEYFFSQLQWLDVFDKFLQDQIPYAKVNGIRFGQLFFNRIKYLVDPLVIQCFLLSQLISKLDPNGEIIYVRKRIPALTTMQDLKHDESASCFEDLLPKICQKYNRNLRIHLFGEEILGPAHGPAKRKCAFSFFSLLKQKGYESIYPTLLSIKIAGAANCLKKGWGKNVLFVHSGSFHLNPVIAVCLKEGFNVYLLSGDKIYDLRARRLLYDFRTPVMDSSSNDEVIFQLQHASQQLAANAGRIFEWISERAGVDISDILLRFFRIYLEETCKELILKTHQFKDFFEKHQVAWMVSHTSSDIFSKSAMLAARLNGKTKALGVQHGIDPFYDRVWHVTDLLPFDYYATTDGFSENKFRSAVSKEPYLNGCEIYQAPHYLKRLERIAKIKRRQWPPKKVLYLPAKLSAHGRYFNAMVYPSLWYFQYQKQLLDMMGQLTDYHFVFKHALTIRAFADKSILPYIKRKQYKNISVITTRHAHKYLNAVDAVFIDRPTTVLFEATAAQLPTLALYAKFSESMITPEMFKYFGPTLQPFSTAVEAVQKLDQFLKTPDPSVYIHRLPLRADSVGSLMAQGS